MSGDFFLADHILPARLQPLCQKMPQFQLNGSTQTVDIEEQRRMPTMNGKRMEWTKVFTEFCVID